MTYSTACLNESKQTLLFAVCLVCLSLSGSASGQTTIHPKTPIGASLETPDASTDSWFRMESEDSCIQGTVVLLGTPGAAQTDPHPPKPHVPIFPGISVGEAEPDTGSRQDEIAEPYLRLDRFKPVDQPQYRWPRDPSWRPPHTPGRFVPDDDIDGDDPAQNGVSNKFHWRPAVLQSIMIQGFQHTYAVVVQERMRRELKGPFFKDWFKSVRGLKGWDDGNKFFTNYVAHPMQGAMTGFIFLQNHDRLKRQKFAESKTYWNDRLKAMLWSAAWSTQWELGPFSQASIGNVGLYKGMAYVDLVVTPTVGTAWMVSEEALDRYIVRHLETKNFALKILIRTLLNPMRAVANALRLKEPWYRDRQFGH